MLLMEAVRSLRQRMNASLTSLLTTLAGPFQLSLDIHTSTSMDPPPPPSDQNSFLGTLLLSDPVGDAWVQFSAEITGKQGIVKGVVEMPAGASTRLGKTTGPAKAKVHGSVSITDNGLLLIKPYPNGVNLADRPSQSGGGAQVGSSTGTPETDAADAPVFSWIGLVEEIYPTSTRGYMVVLQVDAGGGRVVMIHSSSDVETTGKIPKQSLISVQAAFSWVDWRHEGVLHFDATKLIVLQEGPNISFNPSSSTPLFIHHSPANELQQRRQEHRQREITAFQAPRQPSESRTRTRSRVVSAPTSRQINQHNDRPQSMPTTDMARPIHTLPITHSPTTPSPAPRGLPPVTGSHQQQVTTNNPQHPTAAHITPQHTRAKSVTPFESGPQGPPITSAPFQLGLGVPSTSPANSPGSVGLVQAGSQPPTPGPGHVMYYMTIPAPSSTLGVKRNRGGEPINQDHLFGQAEYEAGDEGGEEDGEEDGLEDAVEGQPLAKRRR